MPEQQDELSRKSELIKFSFYYKRFPFYCGVSVQGLSKVNRSIEKKKGGSSLSASLPPLPLDPEGCTTSMDLAEKKKYDLSVNSQ